MNLQEYKESIPDLTGLLVVVIMISSFVLSFVNLNETAIDAGISRYLAWMFPVCIDCMMIASSLFILRVSLKNGQAYVGWAILITFTMISAVFNVVHSPDGIVSKAAHLIPPVALMISTEVFMMTIKSDLSVQPADTKKTPTQKLVEEYFAKNKDSSVVDAANELGISRTTVTKYRPED